MPKLTEFKMVLEYVVVDGSSEIVLECIVVNVGSDGRAFIAGLLFPVNY